MSALPDSFIGTAANDTDAQETREWLDALQAVIGTEGPDRAHYLLERLIDEARQAGIDHPFSANTAYVNTIPADQEERSPGNIEIEERLRTYMRWNAMAMVVKANRLHPADGGDRLPAGLAEAPVATSRARQPTLTLMVCQPRAPSGAGGDACSSWTLPVPSVARTLISWLP